MIFVTVGSTQFRFQRLLDAIGLLPGGDLVVQHGPGTPPASAAATFDFAPFAEVVRLIEEAEIVISHAGVGSMALAMRAGHTPLVVPRLRRFGEVVDDHQLQLTRALGAEGKVIPVVEVDRIVELVATAPPRGEPRDAGDRRLHEALANVLAGERVGSG